MILGELFCFISAIEFGVKKVFKPVGKYMVVGDLNMIEPLSFLVIVQINKTKNSPDRNLDSLGN